MVRDRQPRQVRSCGNLRCLCHTLGSRLVSSARPPVGRHRWAWRSPLSLRLVQNLPVIGRDGSIPDGVTDVAGALVGIVAGTAHRAVRRACGVADLPKGVCSTVHFDESSTVSGEGAASAGKLMTKRQAENDQARPSYVTRFGCDRLAPGRRDRVNRSQPTNPRRALSLSWDHEMLTIRGSHLPGKSLEVWYLEAFCRPGSTRRDWKQTVIPHTTHARRSQPPTAA